MLHYGPVPNSIVSVNLEAFIARWQAAGGAERANYQAFLSELCDVLDVPRPDPAVGSLGPYRFERRVDHTDGIASTARRIDLYRRERFVCEAKQGNDAFQPEVFTLASEAERRTAIRRSPQWMRHMERAKQQAEGYVRDVPPNEGAIPFLLVVDIGSCIDL